jgi:hypothetical protein
MLGFWTRDREHGCEGVHDDLFVRALSLTHSGQEALLMAFDLCLVGREEADRLKGAMGRVLDLAPRQILLNASHTHSGPAVPSAAFADYGPPDRLYVRELEAAAVRAACQAREEAREVTLWAGAARSALPMNRRKKDEAGRVSMRPNPEGVVCDHLPVCLLRDGSGDPVCLLFSVSCHPSTISGYEVSAEYPGVAMGELDARLGRPASMFLQGTGADAKASVIGRGEERWRRATWEDVAEAGRMVAREVSAALDGGLSEVEPALASALVEMQWPLAPVPDRAAYEAVLADPSTADLKQLWARRMLALLGRGERLPDSASVLCHGLKLGRGLRMVALEGEPVAELGLLILGAYRDGVTFPLGYTDGAGLYLVTSAMLEEGGYEAESYFEFGLPTPPTGGLEAILRRALGRLHALSIT